MAAAKKKKPQEKGAGASGSTRSLRDDAEKHLTRSRKISTDIAGQTPEQLNHELGVHQIELEMQAEELRESKIALEESRDKYLNLYEFAPVGYLTLTEKGIITNANLTGATLLGVERSTLIRAPVSKFITEKDSDTWHQYFVNVRQQGEKKTCILMLTRGDGFVFPARLESTRLNGSEGTARVRVVISDITDIRHAEEALRESEEKYRTLFNNMIEGFAYCRMIYDSDGHPEDFIYLNVNQAFDRTTGTKTVTMKRVTEVYPGIRESYPELFVIYGRVASTGTPESFEINFKPIEKWLHISVYSPEKEYFVAIFEDITERKRAEEELRESKALVDAVVENVPLMIFLKEATDLRFVIFNRAGEELLGYDRKALLGKNNLDLFPPEQAAHFMTKDRDVLDGELSMLDIPEESILTAKKGLRLLHTRKVCIRGADGTTKFLLGISEDITERKQAENTIALTTRKLTLMNDVAYQYIQNKVTAVRGYAELSKDTKTETERLSFIEKEEHILADIHQLIKNTRDYQEIGSILPRWIPVEQSIRIAVSLVSPKQNIPVETILQGLELYTDPLIEKIFANLIENAVIHGKTTTRITFSCEETPEGLILICEDDGVGISPEIKTHLFDRSVGERIHFGLFFIRECLLLSGMTIIETGEPGKGARFEITVPKGAYRFGRLEGQ